MSEKIIPQVKKVDKVLQSAQRAQGVQVPIVSEGHKVSVGPLKIINREIKEALLALARAMTTHVIRVLNRERMLWTTL